MEKTLHVVSSAEMETIHWFFGLGFLVILLILYARIPRKKSYLMIKNYRLALYKASNDIYSWKACEKYVFGLLMPITYIFKLYAMLDQRFTFWQLCLIVLWIVSIAVISNIIKYRIINYRLSKIH